MLQITENRSPKVKEKEEPQEDDWSKTKVYEGVTRLFRENLLLIIIKVLPVVFDQTTVSPSDTIIFFFLFLLFWFSLLLINGHRRWGENQKSPIFDWKKEEEDYRRANKKQTARIEKERKRCVKDPRNEGEPPKVKEKETEDE